MTAIVDLRPLIALDADVLIYSVVDHPLGRRIRALLDDNAHRFSGSTLLLPETLIKPTRTSPVEREHLASLLANIDLEPATQSVCSVAVALGAKYRLATVDAVHLATATETGADAFLTNNRNEFDQDLIDEIEVLYPTDLPG